eukprot:CAMPEP_0170205742 /NCGR_PEP_ID=MMETSP0116_2-20130129/2416_1 /TAXON_ID=400756 /ORGANISM="Durinskia baltica, Strain CSIRO CS-38" /LENGTH=131 /DNA_ID=CAMNT_0010456135 /DNA_START=57 /DNA_END=452 /DNA_ORIENTATION=-
MAVGDPHAMTDKHGPSEEKHRHEFRRDSTKESQADMEVAYTSRSKFSFSSEASVASPKRPGAFSSWRDDWTTEEPSEDYESLMVGASAEVFVYRPNDVLDELAYLGEAFVPASKECFSRTARPTFRSTDSL